MCACAMRDGVGRFEIELRAGLHTGGIHKRGEHELKGVPCKWAIYAVRS
jgi:hypothetical protein